MKNSMQLKEKNRNNVYRYIYQSQGVAKQDIANALGLSLPTVSQNLSELKEKGLITEKGTFESTGGRKPKMITCEENVRVALGLDITRNHIALVLTNLKGEILKSSRQRLEFETREAYFQTVGKAIEEFTKEAKVKKDRVLGLGVSVPAIVREDQKSISYMTVIPEDRHLHEDLCRVVEYPVLLFNDANAGGYGEVWRRDSQNSLVYLSLSNSVGGSILFDQNSYPGMNNRSGEFGHMALVPDGRQCYCGQKGCADAYCNAKLLSDITGGSLGTFFKKLEEGDSECQKAFNDYLYYLSLLVKNLRMAFDSDVVLGGYVGSYMEPYLSQLTDMVDKLNPFEQKGSYVKVCKYRSEASAVGAALHFVEDFISAV